METKKERVTAQEHLREEHPTQREQPVQRAWAKSELVVSEEQRRARAAGIQRQVECGWSGRGEWSPSRGAVRTAGGAEVYSRGQGSRWLSRRGRVCCFPKLPSSPIPG